VGIAFYLAVAGDNFEMDGPAFTINRHNFLAFRQAMR